MVDPLASPGDTSTRSGNARGSSSNTNLNKSPPKTMANKMLGTLLLLGTVVAWSYFFFLSRMSHENLSDPLALAKTMVLILFLCLTILIFM